MGGSHKLLPARGCRERFERAPWKIVDKFDVLGFIVQSSGSTHACAESSLAAARRSFWAQLGQTTSHLLSDRAKCKLIERSCLPQITFRAPQWAADQSLDLTVDKFQRKFYALVLQVKWAPDDDFRTFASRRARLATKAIEAHAKPWSQVVHKQIVRWAAHLQRHPSHWACQLLRWRGHKWLQGRRLALGSSAFGGRTDTRALPGGVCTRWQDGFLHARQTLLQRGALSDDDATEWLG